MILVEDPAIRTRILEILELQVTDNTKSWLLRTDGKYERVQPKAGAPLVRAQARFIELTRDRVRAAEAGATSSRFYLSRQAPSSRTKTDDKSSDTRRARREARDSTKGH
jgi:polyphosphate kinase